ncbi:MAG: hypothetical protein GTO51_01415 [Candidatus Latescibacteria bacterium]|nr:hypothetical protein [Candidatus Latescibacterota bacterium]NIM21659.1 hypothetical protein [Candidatus Latescibacterota bacterium]NIM64638.1 hypothetical protein [Candidatus Latescibacterota bacterium]NIO01153.1 hypothetical protein [Candidatus Latescibacterota bacterium]NIO27546.1 hypothetical protein [Candidatus Latescibacterota bacterium]
MNRSHLCAELCVHILDAIRDPILIVDGQANIILSNRSAGSAFNLRASDNIASLEALDACFEFDVMDVLGLLKRIGSGSGIEQRQGPPENIYNHQLKNETGHEVPVYVDIVNIVNNASGGYDVKHDRSEDASEFADKLPSEATDLKLLRFKDLSFFRKSEKWRDESISMISHDIRNPLSAIRNSMSLLLSGMPDPLTPIQEQFLKTAVRSIDRLTHLLDGVLDLSRIDSGAFKPNPSWIPLEQFVNDVLTSFGTLFNVRRVKLKSKVVGDIEQIYVDAYKLEQVLFNLLSNALKFTPEGGHITLSARPVGVEMLDEELRLLPWKDLPDLKLILFTVEDTGLGMNEKTLANLFTRYYQQDEDDEHGGSHLGLSISKRLIEAQGGTIDVESQLGIGTAVKIRLPCDERTGYLLDCIRSMKTHLERVLAENRQVAFYSIGKESGECWINLAQTWRKQPMINPTVDEKSGENLYLWTLSEYLAVAIMANGEVDELIKRIKGDDLAQRTESAEWMEGRGESDGGASRVLVESGRDPMRQPEGDSVLVPEYPFDEEAYLDGKVARFDGYTVGLCLAPDEGTSLARLFNLSMKRLTKAGQVEQRFDIRS